MLFNICLLVFCLSLCRLFVYICVLACYLHSIKLLYRWQYARFPGPITHSAQTHDEENEVKENAWANFSYPLSGISGKMLKNSDYNIEIKVCENGIFLMACWCRCVPHNNILCRNEITESFCHADNSEMRLSLLVKRSYSDIVWELFRQGDTPVVLKHTRLKFLCK